MCLVWGSWHVRVLVRWWFPITWSLFSCLCKIRVLWLGNWGHIYIFILYRSVVCVLCSYDGGNLCRILRCEWWWLVGCNLSWLVLCIVLMPLVLTSHARILLVRKWCVMVFDSSAISNGAVLMTLARDHLSALFAPRNSYPHPFLHCPHHHFFIAQFLTLLNYI